jgi:hypothetical protein
VRYGVVPPPGFVVVEASYSTGNGIRGWSQLWATPGSATRSGHWISVFQTIVPSGFDPGFDYQQGTFRLAIGDAVAVVLPAAGESDTTTATMFIDRFAMSVETFGVPTDLLSALLGSIAEGSADGATDGIEFDRSLMVGYGLIADATDPWSQLQPDGLTDRFTAIGPPVDSDGYQYLRVTTARSSPIGSDPVDALPFILDSTRVFSAPDGSIGIAGYDPGVERAKALWVDSDGWSVQVDFDGTVDEVIALAKTAYRVTDEEWIALGEPQAVGFPSNDEPFTQISRQVDQRQLSEQVSQQTHLRRTTVGDRVRYRWMLRRLDDNQPGNPLEYYTDEFTGEPASITTMSSPASTTVLATVPNLAADSKLTVYPAGGEPIVRDFAVVGFELDVVAATAIVEQVGPFTATITSSDGTLLAVWPPLPEL